MTEEEKSLLRLIGLVWDDFQKLNPNTQRRHEFLHNIHTLQARVASFSLARQNPDLYNDPTTDIKGDSE